MNNYDKNDNMTDEILKNNYNQVEPLDSWQELRARIDSRIDSENDVSKRHVGNMVFWRRLALGMAACFLVTAGTLFCFLRAHYGTLGDHKQQIATANNPLNQTDLDHLSFTFSQVQQLFGQQSQWIIVGSGDNTQMGIADRMVSKADNRKIIVVRLAINYASTKSSPQYFDIVTYSNQQINFQLPIEDTSAIEIFLTPKLKNSGKIELEMFTKSDGLPRTDSVSDVFANKYTQLVGLKTNDGIVNIEGVAKSIPQI